MNEMWFIAYFAKPNKILNHILIRMIAFLIFAIFVFIFGYIPSAYAVSITNPNNNTPYIGTNGSCNAASPTIFYLDVDRLETNLDEFATYFDVYVYYLVDANNIILSSDYAYIDGTSVNTAHNFHTDLTQTTGGNFRIVFIDTITDTKQSIGETIDEVSNPVAYSLSFNPKLLDSDCGNQAPIITNGANISVSLPENQTSIIDINSTDDIDSEGAGLTYSISAGVDQALFNIDNVTGALTFSSPVDYENPGDSNADNIYLVEVSVSDNGWGSGSSLSDVISVSVAVSDVFETSAPIITGGATANIYVDENQISVTDINSTDDLDSEGVGNGLTYSITGGVDQALFNIYTYTGVLTFKSPPDFENPSDIGANNIYNVQVSVSDSANLVDVQDVIVTVNNVAENNAPIISGGEIVIKHIDENQILVTDIVSTDDNDSEGAGLTYSISGGADQALFNIDSDTGILTFITAPDFENPADVGENNIYEVHVRVSDSGNLTDTQEIIIAINNISEGSTNNAPIIAGGEAVAINLAEKQTMVIDIASVDDHDSEGAGNGLVYSITGGVDQAKFNISAYTGVLSFNSAPDFENPTDIGADNVYNVQITLTDSGSLIDVQDIAITITNVNEDTIAPTLTIVGAPTEYSTITPFTITYIFSENVTGVDLDDINAGLINANASDFLAVSPTNYSVTITPTGVGDIIIGMNANVAVDASGNGNIAATSIVISQNNPLQIVNETQKKISKYIDTRSNLILTSQPKLTRRINRITGRRAPQPRASVNLLGFSPSVPAPIDVNLNEKSLSYSAILSQFPNEENNNASSNTPLIGSIDIWSEGNISKFNDGTGGDGYFSSIYAGFDYLFSPTLLAGVSIGIDVMEQKFANLSGEAKSNGFMIGPYALFKFDDNFYIDMSASWGQSANEVRPFGTYSDQFTTKRLLLNTALVGDFKFGDLTISPSVSVQYLEENQQEYIDGLGNVIGAQKSWQGDIRFSPRLAYNHKLIENIDVTTWVEMSGIYSFSSEVNGSSSAPNIADLSASISAGVDFATFDGMNLAISAQYFGIGKQANSYGLSLRFRAPLN